MTNSQAVAHKTRRSVVAIITAQLHSTKPELRFCAGSNPARLNHTTKTIHHHHHHHQKLDGDMLPSRSMILAEPINKTIFPSYTVATFIVLNDSVS